MANPPITIGPFNNVPAPGSPIRSDFAQSIATFVTNQVVRRDVATVQTVGGEVQWGGDPVTSEGIKVRGNSATLVQARSNSAGTAGSIHLLRAAAAAAVGQRFLSFEHSSSGIIGSISIATSTTVAYNTSSDPRLKVVTGDAGDAAAIVRAIGAAAFRGRWVADVMTGEPDMTGPEWVLLSSHDVEDHAPWAVTGTRDAVDEQGRPVAQMVNYPSLVPVLFAALEQTLARIDELEAAQ